MELILKGAIFAAGLIVAIGAQNAFVLKNALMKNHIFWIVLTCFLCDMLLMFFGMIGLASVINTNRVLTYVIVFSGIIFLLWYMFCSFYKAFTSTLALEESMNQAPTMGIKSVILSTLAVTLLNPQVYLDMVVILGGMASTMTGHQRNEFFIGAAITSLLWFFGLGYGARLLLPLFKHAKAWRVLEFITGCVMLWIVMELLKFLSNKGLMP